MAPESDKLAGRVVLERYRLGRRLGVGGMGMVYEAEHVHLGTKHAVKVLHLFGEVADGLMEQLEARFLREAKICASIRHPNLVPVTDFGTSDGVPYLVMDFIDGEDLKHVLDKLGALGERKSLVILRDVAGAVGALHEKGILHRDLKPANVMIERATGRAVLTDLGIAKDLGSGTQMTQGILGTPAYMAPEQMTDASKTSRESDIYALGATFYAMLTGRDPFGGTHPLAVLQKARESLFAYRSVAGVAKNRDKLRLDPRVESLLHEMTMNDREERIHAASEVVSRIDAMLAELGDEPDQMTLYLDSRMLETDSRGFAQREEEAPEAAVEAPSRRRHDTSSVLAALTEAEPGARRGRAGLVVFFAGGIVAALGVFAYVRWIRETPPELPEQSPETGAKVEGPPAIGEVTRAAVASFLGPEEAPRRLRVPLPGARPLELVLVPPGEFRVGSDDPESPDEGPSREVELTRSFYIGRFEVTVGQFASFLNEKPPRSPGALKLAEMGLERAGEKWRAGEGEEDRPARAVTHAQARSFCRWVSENSGLKVELPGEVEWEYAARGPDSPVYPWGNEWERGRCCAGEECPAEVGSYPEGQSWCGAEDTAGNVFEWCAERYDARRYRDLPARDPGILGAGSSDGLRVFRGGCFGSDEYVCRASYRNGLTGTGTDRALGFRVKASATDAVLDYAAGPEEEAGEKR